MSTKRLEEIKGLVKQLEVSNIGSHINVTVDKGRNEGTTIWNEEGLSVHVWSADAGTVYPAHSHEESEWIIMSRGEIRIKLDLEEISDSKRYQMCDGFAIIREGDYIYIPACVVHQANFNMESEYVTVHVPRSLDYAFGNQ